MNTLSAIVTGIILAAAATPAAAATAPTANKTWVSSTGTDSGSCSLAAPCKTFAYAITVTNAGGEIDVKDSGGYGGFTIDKAVSIIADGVVASVNSPGITIHTGAQQTVMIHGLTVNTHTFKSDAIVIFDGAIVTLDHDILQGSGHGLNIGLVSGANPVVTISNCIITGNNVGILAGGTEYLYGNIISDNNTGIYFQTNRIYSYGNNGINGNISSDLSNGSLQPVSLR